MQYYAKPPLARDQLVLFEHRLEDAVPEDHAARILDEILAALDWSAWEATYHGARGQPPIPPRVLAALVLYGLSAGIRSSRRLEQACQESIPVRWLVEGRTIDHSTVCEFRGRFRRELKDLFAQVCTLAMRMGLVRLGRVGLDGTRVRAHNNRYATLTAEKITQRLAELEAEFETWLAECERQDAAERSDAAPPLPPELRRLDARREKLKAALAEAQARDAARQQRQGIDPQKNPAQVPSTDPDATVLPNKEGGYAPNYTPLAAVDAHRGFLVDAAVINDTVEHREMVPAVERIARQFGTPPAQVLVDGAFVTGENLAALEARGVELYSPMASSQPQEGNPARRDDPTQPVPDAEQSRLPRNSHGQLDKSCFTYVAEQDTYYCPQGRPLPYEQTKTDRRPDGAPLRFRLYRSRDCGGCPLRPHCLAPTAKGARTLRRDDYEHERERLAARMATPQARQIYDQRMHLAETPFGTIKGALGLRQFLHRGLDKVTHEWLWTCTAFNTAKLIREVARWRRQFRQLAAAPD